MPVEVIGRDDELDSLRAFLAEIEQGPTALVLSGEAGIGKTILWEAAVEEAAERFGRVLTYRERRGRGVLAFAGLSDLLAPVLEEVAARARCRRGGGRWRLALARRPGRQPPDAPRSVLPCSTSWLLAESGPSWSRSMICSGSIPPRRCRSAGACGGCAMSRSASWPRCVWRPRPPCRSSSSAPSRGAAARLSLGPLSLGALHHLLQDRLGLELSPVRARACARASAGNPFFALELAASSCAGSEAEARQAAACSGAAFASCSAGVWLVCPGDPSTFCCRPRRSAGRRRVVAAAHGDRDASWSARGGRARGRHRARRFSRSLHSSAACLDLLRAGARPGAPRRSPRPCRRGRRRRGAGRHLASPPRVRTPRRRRAGGRRRAGRRSRRDRRRGRALRARRRADAGRPRRGSAAAVRAAELHWLAGDRERAAALLEQLLDEVPAGVERADILFALAMDAPRRRLPRMIQLWTRPWPRRRATTRARRGSWPSGAGIYLLVGTDVRAALSDARAALEKAERAATPRCSPLRSRGWDRRGPSRRAHPGPARAWCGDRGAPRARARLRLEPTLRARTSAVAIG